MHPKVDTIQRRHLSACKKPSHQHPHLPGEAVDDNNVLRVMQRVAERRKLRARKRAQHPEEWRDLVRNVPGRGRDADEADNGAITKLDDGEDEGSRPLLRSRVRGLGWSGIGQPFWK